MAATVTSSPRARAASSSSRGNCPLPAMMPSFVCGAIFYAKISVMVNESTSPLKRNRSSFKAIVILIVVFPYILIVLVAFLLWALFLHVTAWLWWKPQGKDILIVYSDSPIWHDYMVE